MTVHRIDAEAQCIRAVVEYVNSGALGGVLKEKSVRPGLQDDLRLDLEFIAAGKNLPTSRLKRLDEEAVRVSMRRMRTNPTDRMPLVNFSFKTVQSIAAFQILGIYRARLIANEFPGDIFQCPACDTFVFSSDVSKPTGNRRSKFCSDECEVEHSRATAADRKAASRMGIPVEVWRVLRADGKLQ